MHTVIIITSLTGQRVWPARLSMLSCVNTKLNVPSNGWYQAKQVSGNTITGTFYSFAASMCHHSTLRLWPSLLLLICSSCALTPANSQDPCSYDFAYLEGALLSGTENRYKLSKTFFPPRDAHPVFVTVNYTFHNSNASTLWYWSESEFYLIQPLEIFLFSSLFLSNFPYRQASITVAMRSRCSGVSDDLMEMLTQRVRIMLTQRVHFSVLK